MDQIESACHFKPLCVINNISQQIKDFNNGRNKDLLAIKYKAMAENPFRFFRGSCQLFYSMLSKKYPFIGSPAVWACGDLHIENFGSYKGVNRLVYFDMNDFDEALLSPLLWEICRLVASVQLAAGETTLSKKDKSVMAGALLNAYSNTLRRGKSILMERGGSRGLIKKMMNKVADRREMDLVKKRTDKNNPGKLLPSARLMALPKKEKTVFIAAFNQWLSATSLDGLQAVDAGFRIAGTGSIGIERYVMLVAYKSNPQKMILMDVKQAVPAAAAAYISLQQPVWQQQAERIIAIQEMMEQVTPAFLASFPYNEKIFVVKELQPTGDKVDVFQTLKPEHMQHYLSDLGVLTASAQLRSSGRKGSATTDELADFAAGDNWADSLLDWSVSYAAGAKQDYAIFKEALQDGFFSE